MKQPPYTHEMIRRASQPNLSHATRWVLIGTNAWQWGQLWTNQSHRLYSILPPGDNPYDYCWDTYIGAPPPVAILRCGEVDGNQLMMLVQCILAVGVSRLYDILVDVVYVPYGVAT